MKGGGLHVSDVALDTGNQERNVAPDTAERLGDGVALDGVSDRGPGGVRLDVVELARCPAGPDSRLAHQQDLGMARRRADVPAWRKGRGAVGRAGGID